MVEQSSLNLDLFFLILLVFTFFMVIVMLNLLIAYISDSFEKLMSTNIQAFNYERLQLIMQFKRQMSEEEIKKLSEEEEGKILFVLQNEDKSAEEDVEERIRIKIDRLEKEIKRGVEEQTRKINEGNTEF